MSKLTNQEVDRRGEQLTASEIRCRGDYGTPVFAQCGWRCVYCGYTMDSPYEAWLQLSVDHVIPAGTIRGNDWPTDWVEDISNLVTCCRTCNEFTNGDRVTEPPPATVDEFFDLRDRHFGTKLDLALAWHEKERAWYDQAFLRGLPAACTSSEIAEGGQPLARSN